MFFVVFLLPFLSSGTLFKFKNDWQRLSCCFNTFIYLLFPEWLFCFLLVVFRGLGPSQSEMKVHILKIFKKAFESPEIILRNFYIPSSLLLPWYLSSLVTEGKYCYIAEEKALVTVLFATESFPFDLLVMKF